MTTVGISPKTVLAFLYPTIVTLVGVAASWITTGNLSDTELRAAAAGLLAALLAALGAYVGKPGAVANQEPDDLVPSED